MVQGKTIGQQLPLSTRVEHIYVISLVIRVGSGAAVGGQSGNDQVGVGLLQGLRAQSDRHSLGGAQVVNHAVDLWHKLRQNNPSLGVFQVDGQALFAGIQV